MLPEDIANNRLHMRVVEFAKRRTARLPCVERRSIDLQRFADVNHFKAFLRQFLNDGVKIGYSCWLKIAKG